jgi:crotonobetainyl-CoA:carnitine CoA-transferase CaiB-like acyl-CoA transferase
MTSPLSGLKVLDVTHVLAGPFCTYMLAVHGAEVIKIEDPVQPDGVRGRGSDKELNRALMGTNFLTQNANKRSMTLNLKSPEGQRVFKALAAHADVVVENYRAGALEQLGLGYDALSEDNPRLIYCSMTGFGLGGPRSTVNAYDNTIQAASGLMAMTGFEGSGPIKVGASIIDYAAGLSAAFAVLLAVNQRYATGRGCHIDSSMLDTAMMLMGTQVTSHYAGASPPVPRGNNQSEAGLGCYDAADGKLMLGAFNARQHKRLWTALERPDLAALSTWDDMHANADSMRAILAKEFASRSVAELEDWLHGLGIPAERVRTIDEGLDIAERQGRRLTAELPMQDSNGRPVRVPLAPFSLSRGSAEIRSAPPKLGEHTDEVLAELGYDRETIHALRVLGAV